MSRITDASVARSAITALQPEPAARDADTISIRSRHTLHTFGGVDDDDEEDPWSAIPRNASSHAVPASEYPALSSAQRNQLLLRALLQLVALFVVCLIGVGGTLYVALPVISAADTPNLKVPRSFDDLKNLNSILQHYKTQHFASVLLCWVVVFMFLQAFSIPGSMYMSILCGALFGVPIALPLVCTSVATGASICYLISKNLGVILIALPSWQMRIDEWKHKLDQHRHNMLSYLVILRMMPLPPHNIVNILSPHLGISLGLFWISTFGGIFAVSVIHTTIGEKLDQMTSAHDFHLFSFRNMVLLGAVGFAVLIPVFVKRLATVENDDLDQGSSAHGQIFLDDDEDEQDELPRRILDTNNLGVDLDESFPNWHNNPNHEHDDAHDDADADETDDEARLGYGRGGVFPDRSTTTRIGL